MENMTKYATHIFENKKKGDGFQDTVRLIIDGIECEMLIYLEKGHKFVKISDMRIFENNRRFGYYIYHHKVFSVKDGFSQNDEITVEIIIKILSQVIKMLDTLVFDKIHGIFMDKKKLGLENSQYEVFKKYMKPMDDCVVCFEPTLEKTPCEHTVCMSCWQKIKRLTCPICRNCIYYCYDFDDRDDDGNEYKEDDVTDDDDD